jgi:hypothetical protein
MPNIEDAFMKKFERNEPYYAAHWFLSRLVRNTVIVDQIELNVYIRKMTKQDGVCWSYSEDPFLYDIVINSKLGRRDSLRALAHEAVHVYQYVTGKMRDVRNKRKDKVLWMRSELLDNSYEGAAYRNAPWEIEAKDMQERLMNAYLRHVRKLRRS